MTTTKLKALVCYSASDTHVGTTLDYLNGLASLPSFSTQFLNVCHTTSVKLDLDSFDLVIHHYGARFIVDGYVNADYLELLKCWQGLKILSVQDEYERTSKIAEAITRYGFQVVLTCVPESQIEKVYGSELCGRVRFCTVLTGYAPIDATRLTASAKPLRDRPIQMGYRGRDIGARFGELGRLKRDVGTVMRDFCRHEGIVHDIEVDESSRLYGSEWTEFVGSCVTMLGVESGSNAFDLDGNLELECRRIMSSTPDEAEAFQACLNYVSQFETGFETGQISPRVFECAALKTPMVLVQGHYSGIVRENEHYIPLARDFSNTKIVFERLRDLDFLEAMAERTHAHLILSGLFSYEAFSQKVDQIAVGVLDQMGWVASTKALPHSDMDNRLLVQEAEIIDSPTSTPLLPAHWQARQRLAYARVLLKDNIRLREECNHELNRIRAITESEKSRSKKAIGYAAIQRTQTDLMTLTQNIERHSSPKTVSSAELPQLATDLEFHQKALYSALIYHINNLAKLSSKLQEIRPSIHTRVIGTFRRLLRLRGPSKNV